MTPTRRRGFLVATALAACTLGMVTAASAYWGGSGSGAGSTDTGTTQPVTLSPATASDQLYPGGQATVALTATNPNPGTVRVSSLALDTSQGTGGFAVDAGHAACNVATLSFTTQTNGGSGWNLPTGGPTSITLANALSMSASAADACQGATFTVYLNAGS